MSSKATQSGKTYAEDTMMDCKVLNNFNFCGWQDKRREYKETVNSVTRQQVAKASSRQSENEMQTQRKAISTQIAMRQVE